MLQVQVLPGAYNKIMEGKMIKSRRSQATLEYVIVLTAIVSAIIFSADRYLKPAVEKMLQKAANVIEKSAEKLTLR